MNTDRLTAAWGALRARSATAILVLSFTCVIALSLVSSELHALRGRRNAAPAPFDEVISERAEDLFRQGARTFREDTFGDEKFWGDTLKLHLAIGGARFGGVGPGVSPATALAVGLKVDVDKVPQPILNALKAGTVDLNEPANTLALLDAKAVVGVTAIRGAGGRVESMGVQCSLCHSTVDDSFAPGIGRRLDGWANRDLNVGAIIALSPDLSSVATLLQVDQSTVRSVLNSWGPGKFDAALLLDGKAFRPDGKSAATLIPPAFGLAGQNLHTFTGWGSVPYWNAFVANLEMHGSGTFVDPRLNDPERFPVAARAGFFDVRPTGDHVDKVTSKLAALQFYQLAIPAPAPPKGSFDERAAERGETLFTGAARCSTCHVPPLFSEPGWAMHTGAEIGIDDFQADRSPDRRYRTTPLKGLWSHQKGGFYHDGRFATLTAVVQHYNRVFNLRLTDSEMNELVEYLKSL
jgi:mono/diheme cytochrome c family protein